MSAFEDIVMKGNRAPYIESDEKEEPGIISTEAHNLLGGLEGMFGDFLKGAGAQLNAMDEAGRESSYVDSIRNSEQGTLGLLGDGLINNGQYLSNQAEDIAKTYGTRQEYSNLGFVDRLTNLDYLTDPRGLAADAFTGLGSSVPFVAASLVAPEITLPGRVLQAARALPFVGRGASAPS